MQLQKIGTERVQAKNESPAQPDAQSQQRLMGFTK